MKSMNEYSIFRMKGALALAAVSISSWYGGYLYEKRKRINFEICRNHDTLKYPGNPLFGTVSAATIMKNDTPENQLVQVQGRAVQIMKHGYPSLNDLKYYDDFVLSYDRRNKIAHWVFEHLTADRLHVTENVDRSKCEFTEDKTVHPYFRCLKNVFSFILSITRKMTTSAVVDKLKCLQELN